MICGMKANHLMLTSAKLSEDASRGGQKLLSLLFTEDELANGNPSGKTNSKDENRQKSIKKPDLDTMKYILHASPNIHIFIYIQL